MMPHAASLRPSVEGLRAMHGEPVFVTPGPSSENPPVGIRGTIRVTPEHAVEIDLQFAVMFGRPAVTKTMRLTDEQVVELANSKLRFGDYALRLDHPIESPPPSLPDVVPNLLTPPTH